MTSFRSALLCPLVASLKNDPSALALWECGSAATGTTDKFSDIDLAVLTDDEPHSLFDKIENLIGAFSPITHKLIDSKPFFAGYFQRVYFVENAPVHFFVDVGILKKENSDTLDELLLEERHGTPVIHFDKLGLIKPRKQNLLQLKEKQRARLLELEAVFHVYVTEVLKSLDRDQHIDAFSFYFGGLIKPLVEVMGMVYRPHRYDFGLRYLHRDFPLPVQEKLKALLYDRTEKNLRQSVREAQVLFDESVSTARQSLLESPS